jgi:hypothetical protein
MAVYATCVACCGVGLAPAAGPDEQHCAAKESNAGSGERRIDLGDRSATSATSSIDATAQALSMCIVVDGCTKRQERQYQDSTNHHRFHNANPFEKRKQRFLLLIGILGEESAAKVNVIKIKKQFACDAFGEFIRPTRPVNVLQT